MIKLGIGKNIKKYRKLCNLTQNELADKLEVSNKTVSSWEIDRTEPTMKYVNKMCEIFSCSQSDLTKSSSIDYSAEAGDFVMDILEDKELTEALEIYFGLPDHSKKEIINFIKYMSTR